ncbi:MAG: adenosylcobinamide-GDP ribazoletransferase [Oscillospiraceae bacterium]|jgi:adenosylcobinamide-GDP ribazoletransferase
MIVWETFVVACSMFSALPMPNVCWTERNMRYALCAFPAIGLMLGGIFWIWTLLCQWLSIPVLLRGAGFCLIPVMLTGGIHLDGYADTCDALASHASAEKKQEILKDAHLGAFAVIRLCFYFVASWALWSAIPQLERDTLVAITLGFCLSRSLSGLAIAVFPLAKDTGLAHTFATAADKNRVAWCLKVFAAVLCIGLFLCGWQGITMVLTALSVFFYYRRMAIRRFGGISGDLAGWFLQTAELAMLAVLTAVQFLEAAI